MVYAEPQTDSFNAMKRSLISSLMTLSKTLQKKNFLLSLIVFILDLFNEKTCLND